jgi:L-aspartate oxidase
MWDRVGIVRDGEGLTAAANTLAAWERQLPPPTDRPSSDLRNAVLTARLIAEAALAREESRGAHFRSDFPEPSPAWLKHLVFVRG